MSNTPETDAVDSRVIGEQWFGCYAAIQAEYSAHGKRLERKLAAARSRIAELEEHLSAIAVVAGRNIAHETILVAVQDLKADYLRRHKDACNASDKNRELEAQHERDCATIAKQCKDVARMNYLESEMELEDNERMNTGMVRRNSLFRRNNPIHRNDIDEAMKNG